MSVSALRVRRLAEHLLRTDGAYVLYWMTAARRLEWNHALDHALSIAESIDKPLLIFEGLGAAYPWASDRHHRFILDGMAEHARALEGLPVGYYPYVEPEPGYDSGLLETLCADACCLVTDDSPVFLTPDTLADAVRLEGLRVDAVDSCGLLPVRAAQKAYSSAYHFRRFLQRELPVHLVDPPHPAPLSSVSLPPFPGVRADVIERWPATGIAEMEGPALIASLPIDHSVVTVGARGGTRAARSRLAGFVTSGLARYADDHRHPDREVTSGLSPWIRHGHISPHEVFQAVADQQEWTPLQIAVVPDGRREGWWGMSESAEAFLDQLVTWRELGYGYCTFEPQYDSYETLPLWARTTLEEHAVDPRPYSYSLEQFTDAETHDELWNAVQRQLVGDGVIHNYLRMLWGKKILEWTRGPREALDFMIELNNRYAIDGCDPNSYSGIFWCMGRFDRGWPERAIYGKVRSMTSASTRKKVSVDRYLERWGPEPS